MGTAVTPSALGCSRISVSGRDHSTASRQARQVCYGVATLACLALVALGTTATWAAYDGQGTSPQPVLAALGDLPVAHHGRRPSLRSSKCLSPAADTRWPSTRGWSRCSSCCLRPSTGGPLAWCPGFVRRGAKRDRPATTSRAWRPTSPLGASRSTPYAMRPFDWVLAAWGSTPRLCMSTCAPTDPSVGSGAAGTGGDTGGHGGADRMDALPRPALC